MKKAVIVIILLGIGALGAFFTLNKNTPQQTQTPTLSSLPSSTLTPDASSSVLGVFGGILPCADCERIKMKLTLYWNPKTYGSTTYQLDQVYVGRGDTVHTEKGIWDTLRGNDADQNATIYGLNLDKPKDQQIYFLKVGDSEVKLLDSNMNEIKSNLNYTLTKQ